MRFTTSFCADTTEGALSALVNQHVDKSRFCYAVSRLHTLFELYTSTSSEPLPTPGLIITAEIRTQCERYLPIAYISAAFNNLYAAALAYPPIFSSTPFHNAMSWADAFSSLPAEFQSSANPARLLETVLGDNDALLRFLCASFLPRRFYGGVGRYPGQQQYLQEWFSGRKAGPLTCLDVACGIGEDTYGLALLLSEHGFSPADITVVGWTLEPLEVWAATHLCIPHDLCRETRLKEATATLIERGYNKRISFQKRDISLPLPLSECDESSHFDLIICNGLLGGPIIHKQKELQHVLTNLTQLLGPGGRLLAANNFHGGWKQKCPPVHLRALFEENGLVTTEAGEGICGLKPDQ
jgi:SAM-dependent methyltransferase